MHARACNPIMKLLQLRHPLVNDPLLFWKNV
jgi:hypothetical protein